MATLSYFSVTSVASPISPDSPSPTPTQNPSLRPTKVVLPNKKPQKWSTGVATGEYGGPPTTTKLRKYWGGDDEDPITSDEFIWNKDFMGRMKKFVEDPSQAAPAPPAKEESSGFLSLNRVMSLDSLEVDLSKELTQPSKAMRQISLQVPSPAKGRSTTASPRWKLVPTRNEQEKWDRATRAATGGSDVMFREARKPLGDPEVLAAESREQYYKLKNRMQILTLGIGGVGLVSAYVAYSPEIAASFGAGFIGSIVYVRMLGSSVDSLADGARGLVKGAIAQPRLLVPAVLVMVYNRWNGILVPNYGFMHLELIPMLVGFFTYKIATFIQAIEESLPAVSKNKEV